MRAVIQRVRSASVEVDGEIVSRIGPGLLCLIGIGSGDEEKDAEFIARKLLTAKCWPHPESGRAWDQNVVQREYELLCVSQFTVLARLKKPRPDFSKAMPPQQAREFYADFLNRLRGGYAPAAIKDGVFGAMMNVSLENDGPVTFIVDSQEAAASSSSASLLGVAGSSAASLDGAS